MKEIEKKALWLCYNACGSFSNIKAKTFLEKTNEQSGEDFLELVYELWKRGLAPIGLY